ncbi:MAG: hypothetical protein ACR2LZ_08260 [Pyrinomonadaceae bacterium]
MNDETEEGRGEWATRRRGDQRLTRRVSLSSCPRVFCFILHPSAFIL